MSDELRERVLMAMERAYRRRSPSGMTCGDPQQARIERLADAAIAIVVEACAEIAAVGVCRSSGCTAAEHVTQRKIITSIRALAKGSG